MRRGGPDPYLQQRPAPAGYYYNRVGSQSGAPSPSQSHLSYRSQQQQPIRDPEQHIMQANYRGRRSMEPSIEESTPSYNVEHLATFAVGRQFGLTHPGDGIRKLKQMEKNSAIWAQPLVMRLNPMHISVEDDNGDMVETFPIDLIEQPTAHISNNPNDAHNNIILFIVKEDTRTKRNATPTEMHIFQCNRVSASDVADDLQAYIKGQFRKVRTGRRSSGPPSQPFYPMPQFPTDDASISSDSSELFERDVNTLNKCFDEIEKFVARIQSAALAQRDLEQQAHRYRTAKRKDKQQPPDPSGLLHRRAQLPAEAEFVDILRKFKLSFNLLAKLKNHIHDPNAPELLHFLFTPLSVILEACHWGLGRNIAPQIATPLLSLEAKELLQNCLNSKEADIWMSLGEAWRTPPEDWSGPLPPPYRPVFGGDFAPYGFPDQPSMHQSRQPYPLHRGESAPPAQFRQAPPARERSIDTAPNTPLSSRGGRPRPHRNMSVDNLDLDRLSFEREKMEFERQKMIDRERRLLEEERKLREERARVDAERKLIHQETSSLQNQKIAPPAPLSVIQQRYEAPPSSQPSPAPPRAPQPAARPILPDVETQSPRQRAFVDDIINRGSKLVAATYDRISQNSKELTVSKGEFLEVLEDSKNWWECRNVHQRIGYVPHTILRMVPTEDGSVNYNQFPPMREQPVRANYGWERDREKDIYGTPMINGGNQYTSEPMRHQTPSHLNGHSDHHHMQSQQQQQHNPNVYTGGQPQQAPQPKPVQFSDAGVQANIHQVVHQVIPQTHQQIIPQYAPVQPQYSPVPHYGPPPQQVMAPPAPPPPPAAPTPSMLEMLREQQLRKVQPKTPALPAREPIAKPSLLLTTRTEEEQQLINELTDTVGKHSGQQVLRPKKDTRPTTVQINDRSSASDVSLWLEEKGFSYRVIELFDGQDGAALFSLNKNHLIQACGRDEGSRLYSQILVQKNRSGYRTHTNAELKAILNYRKTHVEITNTTPADEPNIAVQ